MAHAWSKRLFTDTDMHDQTLREEMENFYGYLQQILRTDQLTIPSKNCDLVLDIMATEDRRTSWSYYYACHDSRCLFWLETYDASYMLSELYGVKAPAHVSALHCHIRVSCSFHNVACRASLRVALLVSRIYPARLAFELLMLT